MLVTDSGKPRASIFTLSHLSDPERMFFVSMLLNEILGWIRTQTGTGSLRAILYMDEIFGYFPPVKNPPSKEPLLTLLKQARAFGLGIILSTQNPVDLDYKGLSNTGTWFIGRLQTERDKDRVLAGLEGAAAGTGFDRSSMDEKLAALGQRIFLLHNAHESEPVIFETRWVLSYLSGPMSREQIKALMADRKGAAAAEGEAAETEGAAAPPAASSGQSPMMPPGIEVHYLSAPGADRGVVYRPAVTGIVDIHYSSSRYMIDHSLRTAFAAVPSEGPVAIDWNTASETTIDPADLSSEPVVGAGFADLPPVTKQARCYGEWEKELLRWIRQNKPLTLYRSGTFGMTSNVNESEGQFRARLAQAGREKRDRGVEKLRKKYSTQFVTLKNRLLTAEQAIDREKEQATSKKLETAVSFGTAILGAFLGRKAVSSTSAYRMGTAMKTASRMGKERMDVERARERASALRERFEDLEARLQEEIAAIDTHYDPAAAELEEIQFYPKSTDISIVFFGLLWLP
ncbi:MAG: hypothetical protein M0P57_01555 [Syntrophales bacterium]|jgi:hypothetical protein|nr:hypothetical protein [Syntrophales bacterium]MDY0044855.1 hypothetical protein [Syntrophales bacterium]